MLYFEKLREKELSRMKNVDSSRWTLIRSVFVDKLRIFIRIGV